MVDDAQKLAETVALEELKERLDNDRDLFIDICDVFFEDFSQHAEVLKSAIETNSVDQFKEHAHTVKGALANLSVKKASELARKLEVLARDNKLDQASTLLKELFDEVERFREFSQRVKKGEFWPA